MFLCSTMLESSVDLWIGVSRRIVIEETRVRTRWRFDILEFQIVAGNEFVIRIEGFGLRDLIPRFVTCEIFVLGRGIGWMGNPNRGTGDGCTNGRIDRNGCVFGMFLGF